MQFWCTSAYSLMLTAFCFTAAPSTAMAIMPAAEVTRLNTFFSGVVGGSYAAEAVSNLIEDSPFLSAMPLEFFSVEDEISDFLQRESSRYARNLFRDQVSELGLTGNLSLSPYRAQNGMTAGRQARNKRKTRLRARLSSRRLGLALIFRF